MRALLLYFSLISCVLFFSQCASRLPQRGVERSAFSRSSGKSIKGATRNKTLSKRRRPQNWARTNVIPKGSRKRRVGKKRYERDAFARRPKQGVNRGPSGRSRPGRKGRRDSNRNKKDHFRKKIKANQRLRKRSKGSRRFSMSESATSEVFLAFGEQPQPGTRSWLEHETGQTSLVQEVGESGGGKKGNKGKSGGDAFSTKVGKTKRSSAKGDAFARPSRVKRGTNGSDPFSVKVKSAKRSGPSGDAFSVKVRKPKSRTMDGDAFSVKVGKAKRSRAKGDPFATKVSGSQYSLNEYRISSGKKASKRNKYGKRLGFAGTKKIKRKRKNAETDHFARDKNKMDKDSKKRVPETGLFKKGVMPKHTER